MAHEQSPRWPKPAWAYAYQIVPPQPEGRLRAVKALLDHERAQARLEDRTWEGRLVLEQQVTHILVVTDNPDQDIDVNRRLEAALRGAEARFALTVPMAVQDEPVTPSVDPTPVGPLPPHTPPGRLPPRE
jgi:hypothetical protein